MPAAKKKKAKRYGAQLRYPADMMIHTTPEIREFLKWMKWKTGVSSVMDVIDDAFKVYHKEIRSRGHRPPTLRKKKK